VNFTVSITRHRLVEKLKEQAGLFRLAATEWHDRSTAHKISGDLNQVHCRDRARQLRTAAQEMLFIADCAGKGPFKLPIEQARQMHLLDDPYMYGVHPMPQILGENGQPVSDKSLQAESNDDDDEEGPEVEL
jgi:hypothetical protein